MHAHKTRLGGFLILNGQFPSLATAPYNHKNERQKHSLTKLREVCHQTAVHVDEKQVGGTGKWLCRAKGHSAENRVRCKER